MNRKMRIHDKELNEYIKALNKCKNLAGPEDYQHAKEEELKKQKELVEYISKYPIDDDWLLDVIDMRTQTVQVIHKEVKTEGDNK